MTSSNVQEWNKEYILANDSESKHSLSVKFGQFMKTLNFMVPFYGGWGSTASSLERSFHVKWTKFQKSSHLTRMDLAEILSSQCTHQEMKILKILLSSHERFQNYSHLNYGSFGLDIESLQFMAFLKMLLFRKF